MTKAQWAQQWTVRSKSDSTQRYTVSLDFDDIYHCSCPKWKFQKGDIADKRHCHHIEDVIDGLYDDVGPEPRFVLYNNQQVQPVYDRNRIVEVRVPLIPFGEEHKDFYATLVYDCLRYGIYWRTLKERRYDNGNSKRSFINYVESRGKRCIQGDWNPEAKRYGPYKYVDIQDLDDMPRFAYGDYQQAYEDDNILFLFTACNVVRNDGKLTMGKGCAAQVKELFPDIDLQLGQALTEMGLAGNQQEQPAYHLLVHPEWPKCKIGAFQTKYHFCQKSDLGLIQGSINALIAWSAAHPDVTIHLPFPGIGRGQLTKKEVLPILSSLPSAVTIWDYAS